MGSGVAERYVASLGSGSQRTARQTLRVMAECLAGTRGKAPAWESLRREQTVWLRGELKARYAAATANKMLSVLRGVLRRARDEGLMEESSYQAAASLEAVRAKAEASRTARETAVDDGVVAKLRGACGNDAAGLRDRALLEVFLGTGMRRAEAAHLDVQDYDETTGVLTIRGERPEYARRAELGREGTEAVEAWLELRAEKKGPLLMPVDRGGVMRFRRLTEQAVYEIFVRLAERAGVPGVTLRGVRRGYVVGLVRAGCTLEQTRARAGHASWLTAAEYEAMKEEMGFRVEGTRNKSGARPFS